MKKILLFLAAVLVSGLVNAADTLTLRIKGMRCEECAHKVRNVLGKVNGVGPMEFNIERRTVTISYDAQLTCADSIEARLAATGRYKASPYDSKEVIRRGIGLQMADMHCQKCADRIMARLKLIEGIDSLAPHLDKHYMFIRYDANKTCKDEIRGALLQLGYTPVNYYTSKNISFAYFLLPEEAAKEETAEVALAIDGVDDATVCTRRKSLAITYVNTETSEERLLQALEEEGIKATLPKPHECREKE
jgi:copper ion binding protein